MKLQSKSIPIQKRIMFATLCVCPRAICHRSCIEMKAADLPKDLNTNSSRLSQQSHIWKSLTKTSPATRITTDWFRSRTNHDHRISIILTWICISSGSDIMAGGLFPKLTPRDPLTASKPYYQDDYTWCIQQAKYFSHIYNFLLAATPECWIIYIFVFGYGTGFVLYLLLQFDLEYKQRNVRDWHYTTWLIALPIGIASNLRFQPKYWPLRLFYAYAMVCGVVVWTIGFTYVLEKVKTPVQRHQISTIDEIVYNDFRLTGSAEVKELLSHDNRVRKHLIFIGRMSQLCIYFSIKSRKSTGSWCARTRTRVWTAWSSTKITISPLAALASKCWTAPLTRQQKCFASIRMNTSPAISRNS